ncbi:MAG: hemolysin family protein [Deltaproteobacteria bacterium]|nr:hemolysin family protein [Sandaracinaceae bacterium]MCX7807898.1 hemolysin family protein [Deltaproteobacteria bacterium]MDW8246783.1 hemolysin family protein [Sandaracinaceae bacterium]
MLALLAGIACVFANAFFVAAEFAFARVRSTRLEALAKAGDPLARRALAVHKRLTSYLAATQLGITIASLGLGWLGEPALASLIEPAFGFLGLPQSWLHGVAGAIAFATISLLHIVLGELVPKSVAVMRPAEIARYSAFPLQAFYLLAFPALWLLDRLSQATLRFFSLPAPEEAEGALSLEELRAILAASLEGAHAEKQRFVIERVFIASDRPVRAIMVPRMDMQVLSMQEPLEAAIERMQKLGFSRYPLSTDGDLDHIVGYVHVKDILFALPSQKSNCTLGDFKREILIVPESTKLGDLFDRFQRTKIPIALVVDEYGGTSGLVTVDDVIAELLGDLTDEVKSAEQPRLIRTEDGTIMVDGALPVDELRLEGIVIDEVPLDGVDTVGGLVLAKLGRIARPGDRLQIGSWRAVVLEVRGRRVKRLKLCPVGEWGCPPEGKPIEEGGFDA